MKKQIGAYSPTTDTHYDSWEDLVTAEADGYVVIITASDPETKEVQFSNIGGRRPTKSKAQYLARKLRNMDRDQYPYTYKFFVRPLWKW